MGGLLEVCERYVCRVAYTTVGTKMNTSICLGTRTSICQPGAFEGIYYFIVYDQFTLLATLFVRYFLVW